MGRKMHYKRASSGSKQLCPRAKNLAMEITAIAELLLCFVVAVNSQLTVNTLPNVLFQNNSGAHSIVEGSVIWLYCTADSATATPTITWTKNSVTLVNDPPHIRIRSSVVTEMSTSSSLVLDNFGLAGDDGNYVCQASDGTATVSSSTLSLTAFRSSTNTLRVETDPVAMELIVEGFIFPLDNRTAVTLGSTVDPVGTAESERLLRCVGGHVGDMGAGSFSPPLAVWVRNGEQVVTDSRITITERVIFGGRRRSTELQISNFSSSDAGVYQCIFSDVHVDSDIEVITSTPLRLDTGVTSRLERVSPQVITLIPPEKLVIETRASGGYQQFEWSRNGTAFSSTQSPFFVRMPADFPNFYEIFVREPTTTDDFGLYEVKLLPAAGQTQTQFYVTRYGEPVTMNLTGDVTVLEGDSVSISCSSTGIPVPTITWYLGTSVAPFAQSDAVNNVQATVTGSGASTVVSFTDGNITSTLNIENIAYPAHVGEYTCVGLNSYRGVDNTSNATVNVQVQVPPEVEVTATLTRVVFGNSTTLTCTVTRSNPMGSYTYRWVHNDSITLSETSSMLNIDILTESNLGTYRCEVTNSAGLNGSNATIIELGDPPSGIAIQPDLVPPVVFSQSVNLMCMATGDPSITYVWVLMGAETTRLNPDPTSGNFTLNITRVNQYGVYICVATNNLGTDVTSTEIIQATIPVTSPDQIINIIVGNALILMANITGFNLPLTSITWTDDGVVIINNTNNIIITHGSFAEPPTTSTLVRDPIQSPMDNGTYEVTVVNPAGLSTTAFTVTVNAPAEILSPQEPTAMLVNETDPVNLTCTARGFPAVDFTWWYQNTTQLMDSDPRLSIQSMTVESIDGFLDMTSTLTIPSVDRADTGNYTCVASNTVIGIPVQDQQEFMLTVNFAPQILESPDNLTVIELDNATISCLTTGRPRPTIAWFRLSDMTQLQSPSADFTIEDLEIGETETRSNLTIIGTQPSDAGAYRCVAVNELGIDTEQATLTVHVVPSILFPLMNFTYVVNETYPVIFMCSATGIPPPEITWMRNGVLLDDNVDSRISLSPSDPEGFLSAGGSIYVVSRNLTISSSRDNDSDTYTCIASNGNAVTPSVAEVFELIVQVGAQILDPPDNVTVVEPEDATFSCLATGRPRPAIAWFRLSDFTLLQPPSENFNIVEQEIGDRKRRSNLTINGTEPSDAGGYDCVAVNEPGTNSENATLTVHVVPSILMPLTNFTYVVNETYPVIFMCSATGIPPPEITWMRNGVLLDDNVDSRISLSPSDPEEFLSAGGSIYAVSRNLTISNTRDNDSDVYTCIASNQNAVTPSVAQEFELIVQVAPKILDPPDNLTVLESENATFSCLTTGRPTPTISWYRLSNVTQLQSPSADFVIEDVEIGDRERRSNLTVIGTQPSDAGVYGCLAVNEPGSSTEQATLLVYVIPTIIFPLDSDFTYTVNETDPVTFTCSATGIPPPEITWLRNGVLFSNARITLSDPSMPELYSLTTVGLVSHNLTLNNTMDADSGTYTCVASNGNTVEPTVTQNFELFVNVAPIILEPPENLTVVQLQSATFLCNVTARPRPQITWWRLLENGSFQLLPAAVNDAIEIRNDNFGERGTFSNLTIVLADPSDAQPGMYVCIATNEAGQDTGNAWLTVHVIPEIFFPNDSFSGYVANATNPVSFKCIATGIPPPAIQWFRGSVLLTPEGEIGSDQSLANTGELNSRLILGTPSQTMISTPAGSIYQVERTLTFNTSGSDTDTYTCIASNINEVQPNATQNFTLFVQVRPVITVPPVDQYKINNGSSAMFQCEASAVPEHDVFWTFTNFDSCTVSIIDTNLPDTDKYQIKRMRGIGAGFGDLTILNVQYADRGTYTCTATNIVGYDVSDANLTVHVYPVFNNASSLTEVNVSLPTSLICLATGFPLPSITWQKEGEDNIFTGDGRISNFDFDIRSDSSSFESSGFLGSGTIKGLLETMTEFNMNDVRLLGELVVVSVLSFDYLERGDTANYTCTATNMLPQTTTLTTLSPSIPLVVLEVPDPPMDVMVFAMGARWLALQWTPAFDGNRRITSFILYRQNINITMAISMIEVGSLMFQSRIFNYNISEDILPFNNYQFAVQACNLLGCSNVSSPSPTAMTLPDIPTAPRNVTLLGISQTSMMVAWEEPTMPNGILGPYNVTYNGTKSYNSTFSDTGSQLVSGEMAVLSGLIPSTDYSIVVMAINTDRFRNSSDPVVGTTLIGPPSPLDPVTEGIQTGGPLTFTLKFPQISTINGPISHYQVIVVLLQANTDVEGLQQPDIMFSNIDSLGIHSDINCTNPGSLPIAYITSEFDATLFPSDSMFIVGDSSQPNDRPDITNGLLCYATTYTFLLRVYPETDLGSTNSRVRRAPLSQRQYEVFTTSGYSNLTTTIVEPVTVPINTTAYFQLRLKPVRDCVAWIDENRSRKVMDIVSAVVQSIQRDCSCSFTEANIPNTEFSCRSIENTVVFRAEVVFTSLGDRYPSTADDIVALVSRWVQNGTTSINVNSARLDVDPSCPTQLESFQAEDCESETVTSGPGGVNATALGGGIGAACVVLLIIVVIIIIVVVILVWRRRRQKSFSPKRLDEAYELRNPSFEKDKPDDIARESNLIYGQYSTLDEEEEKDKNNTHL